MHAPLTRYATAFCTGLILCGAFGVSQGVAGGTKGTARAAMTLFAEHCFSPFMTADKAAKTFALSGASYDFYDLAPFSSAAPSPVTGRPATLGTDRRCEISFAGDFAARAAEVAVEALAREGIKTETPLPQGFAPAPGTALLAARKLNPSRVAVVHVGTRKGGTETFMQVERLEKGRGLEGEG